MNFRVISKEIRGELQEMGLLSPDEFYSEAYEQFIGYKGRVEKCLEEYIKGNKVPFLESELPKKRRDNHHIIPRSRKGEGFVTSHKTNLIMLEYDFHHNRWHSEHKNYHPLEILDNYFISQQSLLNEEVRTKIGQIADIGMDLFYRKEVLS